MAKKWYLTLTLATLCGIGIIRYHTLIFPLTKTTVTIGILHSLTGDLAISEQPVADAALLAIKEINEAGGILGHTIVPLLMDGKSDENVFAQEATRLIQDHHVAAIFGCWSSPSRIKVKKIVEQYDSLLFYPVQFEGLEDSKHIVYASTTPNQQVIPGITWCLQHLGKSFFLVGTDLILHEIIKDVVIAHGGTIAGEHYLELGDKNVNTIIQEIITTKPAVIINNIEGLPNVAFFTELRKQGITPEKIPTMSFSISEPELKLFNTDVMTGDYATWSYFESIENTENKNFITKVETAYGKDHDVSDAMEAAYNSIYLWKQAVEKAGSTQAKHVIPALHNQAIDAPQGIIHIAENSLHMWQFARVGKIRSDKMFTIVWSSEKSIKPMPYPPTRTVEEWDNLRLQLSKKENL